MSFEAGIPVTKVRDMHANGFDLKKTARIISNAFIHMIFEKGFVHSDPHPGNLLMRKKIGKNGKEDLELVILDHGLYTNLTKETRLSYTKLWRGILSQDMEMIKEGSIEMGADYYELFAAMVVNRTYKDIMNKDKSTKTKSRLGMVKS